MKHTCQALTNDMASLVVCCLSAGCELEYVSKSTLMLPVVLPTYALAFRLVSRVLQ